MRDFDIHIGVSGKDEIANLATAFNSMAEALRYEDELRRRIMTDVAHELKTPLTIIKANIEAYRDGIVENALENISFETERLIRLIKGIEDISRVEAGFFKKIELSEVNLHEFLSDIIDEFHQLADNKGLGIVIEGDMQEKAVTDTEKLYIIVSNLISNAIKFTESGIVRVAYLCSDKEFEITVSDTGSGIEPCDIDQIFTRFYKSSRSNGLGLGLSIVRELLYILHGRVRASNLPQRGAAFRVTLPRAIILTNHDMSS